MLTNWPTARCCMNDDEYCVCTDMERALRGWIREDDLPDMTENQRAECLKEIDLVEGYSSSEYDTYVDADLARAVLSAWTDYARDKGLL